VANIGFVNNTSLDDQKAKAVISQLTDLVEKGESYASDRLSKAERSMEVWRGNLWSEEDREFFKCFDMDPYEFRVHRPLLNTLVTRQRSRKFKFDVVPQDPQSYQRYRTKFEEFYKNNQDRFPSEEIARHYFDNYADDEYAKVLSAIIHNTRWVSKASRKETEVFEEAVIGGQAFLKAIYGRKYDSDGGIQIEKVSQRAVFFDEGGVEYDLSDIEFISQVHRMYVTELMVLYPNVKDEIFSIYESYTNLKSSEYNKTEKKNFSKFYSYDEGYRSLENLQIKVVEMWFRDVEDRYIVFDTETGEEKLVKEGLTPEEIYDGLKILALEEMMQNVPVDQAEFLDDDGISMIIEDQVRGRYELRDSQEFIWRKAVFTPHTMLEFSRSPLPHGSHPFVRFCPQFTDGEATSIMDDIIDVIMAINKALAFRELMTAHGAKGLVLVDQKTLEESGYDLNDIADQYSSMGGIIGLKLRPGRRLQDVFQQVTTIGQGLAEINSILADLDNRLQMIAGVNMAQLGFAQGETPTSRYNMQLQQGEGNNGLVFDNFFESLQDFYNSKVLPMVAEYAEVKKGSVVRLLGESSRPWIEIPQHEDYTVFVDAVRAGKTALVLVPVADDPQRDTAMSAKLMELSMNGIIPIEMAFEFSNIPDRYKIIQRLHESRQEQAQRAAMNQVDMQLVQQMLMQTNLPHDVVMETMKNMRLETYKQQTQAQNAPSGGNSPTIMREAGSMERQENLEQTL
jgi:hypothetical protein